MRDGLVGAVVEDVLSAVSDLEAVDAPVMPPRWCGRLICEAGRRARFGAVGLQPAFRNASLQSADCAARL